MKSEKRILVVDDGPDIIISDHDQIAHVHTFCPKSGKNVGSVSLYRSGGNLMAYITDKRQAVGKNRQAFVVREQGLASVDTMLLVTKNNTSVKAALRQAGYTSNLLAVSLVDAVVTEAEG